MPDALHRAEHRDERQLDAAQDVVHLAVDQPLLEDRAQGDARGGGADRVAIGLVRADREIERLLLEQIVDAVVGTTRIEQVGGDRRVEGRLDAVGRELAGLGLEVVRRRLERGEQTRELLGRDRRERDATASRDGVASVLHPCDACLLRSGEERGEGRLVDLDDLHLDRLRLLLGGRHRLVELVDPAQQRAELEAPEHLLESGAVGRVDDQARPGRCRSEDRARSSRARAR